MQRPAGGRQAHEAGELCVRHGGVWSAYDSPRGKITPALSDDRVAKVLPAPVSVTQSEVMDKCRNGHLRTSENTYARSDGRQECKECKRSYQSRYKTTSRFTFSSDLDPEIAAMAAIVEALDGLGANQLKRVMSYVAARLEENE
jgi:hypothetical protein